VGSAHRHEWVDQADAGIAEMAGVARGQLGLVRQRDAGDQGVAQIHGATLRLALRCQLGRTTVKRRQAWPRRHATR
jgi:hypothetical protein